jgi:hypothetical protein
MFSEIVGQFGSRPIRLRSGAETLQGEEREMFFTENVTSCLCNTSPSLLVQKFSNFDPQRRRCI